MPLATDQRGKRFISRSIDEGMKALTGIILIVTAVMTLMWCIWNYNTIYLTYAGKPIYYATRWNTIQYSILLLWPVMIIFSIGIVILVRETTTKKCPHCMKKIHKNAVICRLCNKNLAEDNKDLMSHAESTVSSGEYPR